jgi:hypothetical protein
MYCQHIAATPPTLQAHFGGTFHYFFVTSWRMYRPKCAYTPPTFMAFFGGTFHRCWRNFPQKLAELVCNFLGFLPYFLISLFLYYKKALD